MSEERKITPDPDEDIFSQEEISPTENIFPDEVTLTSDINPKSTISGSSSETKYDEVMKLIQNGDFNAAAEKCTGLTAENPKNAEVFLLALMCECEVSSKEELSECDEPFDNSENYIKLLQTADEALLAEIKGYLDKIHSRIYNEASEAMKSASSEDDFFQISCLFEEIPNYKDSAALARLCKAKSEYIHHSSIYKKATERLRFAETWAPNETTLQAYEASIAELKTIPDWEDAKEKLALYQARLFDIRVLMEKSRDIREEKAKKKKHKRTVKIIAVITSILVLLSVLSVGGYVIFAPKTYFHKIDINIEQGRYEEQYRELSQMRGLKPIDNILNRFVWLPTQRITTGTDVFISLKLEYSFESSVDFIEGEIENAYFTMREATVDSQWHPLSLMSEIEIEYDKNGNKLKETTVIGNTTTSVEYKYDSEGQCTEEIRNDDGKETTLEHRYNSDGTRKKSLSSSPDGDASHEYVYDESKVLLSEIKTDSDGEKTQIQYEYDDDGNILRSTTTMPNGVKSYIEYRDYELYYVGN